MAGENSLLSLIKNAFFKGLDGLLNAAAEYQNDMGKLKSVYNIPVKDNKGEEKYVKIMLSPVTGKDNIFYVEVDSDMNLKYLSSLDKKTFKIDKTNQNAFNSVINTFLEKNGLTRIEAEEVSHDDSAAEEVTPESEEGEESSEIAFMDKVKPKTVDATVADDRRQEIYTIQFIIYQDGTQVLVDVDSPYDVDKSAFLNGELKTFDSSSQLDQWVKKNYTRFLDDNGLRTDLSETDGYKKINSSTSIKVTLNKTGYRCVDLTKISCSNIIVAMDTVSAVAEDDDFIDAMPDGQSSYSITETDDEFDVEQIEELSDCDNISAILKSFRSAERHLGMLLEDAEGEDAEHIEALLKTVSAACDAFAELCTESESSEDLDETLVDDANSVVQKYCIDALDFCYSSLDDDMKADVSALIDTLEELLK